MLQISNLAYIVPIGNTVNLWFKSLESLELGPSFTPAFPGASGSEALEVGTASMSARRESSDSELVLCFFLARGGCCSFSLHR